MASNSIRQFLMQTMANYRAQQKKLTTKDTVVIETDKGPIKGAKWFSLYDQPYYSFERIPFAKPPLEDLRFKAPVSPDPWTEVKNCTRQCEVPLQQNFVFSAYKGTEDCLYLNVYTKNLNPTKPLPVMVWIFGGGFQIGDASRDLHGPDYLMSKDVVLITINYRLGAFGFLSFTDKELNIPGNAGLKDQIMALQWVKTNCARFGGDPENITLFGESAGGASVHLLMMCPRVKGLFHKAIITSGSVFCSWAVQPNLGWAYRMAKILGYMGDEKDVDIYKFLSKASGASIVKASVKTPTVEELRKSIQFAFGPVIEPYITDQCVIPEDPKKMLKNSWSNEIPLLIGGNSFEGLYFYPDIMADKDAMVNPDNYLYLAPQEIISDRHSPKCKEISIRLLRAHFGDKRLNGETIMEFLDYLSYKVFWHPIHRTVLSRLEYSSQPTYLFRFDFDSAFFNHIRTLRVGNLFRGVSHADDVGYLFYCIYGKRLPEDSPEYMTIQRMVGIWTSFAEKGDPNCDAISEVQFKPVSKEELVRQCLNISNDVDVIDLPESKKLAVWDGIYEEAGLF